MTSVVGFCCPLKDAYNILCCFASSRGPQMLILSGGERDRDTLEVGEGWFGLGNLLVFVHTIFLRDLGDSTTM